MSSEIAKAYVQIMPSMQGIKGKLKAAMNDEAVSAGTSSGKTLGSTIASGLKSAASAITKAATVAVGAGTAAATALVKNAVDYYADYEQLVGGVETLFGDSANTIKSYALDAYQTAGLTANEYMETTTSFAASLLQGLSGNTAKAAEYANTAVTDMADNANKMGSSMESIQNAYQGFAKQNYTMLDNLKLGYGGTASEMARLINDSGVLGDTITVTADTVNDVSFAKIIEAIHTVQDNMGITGTTALEASETISGSVATMKSSWKNLVGAMANGNADIGYFVDNFVESTETAAQNVLPAVETAIGGIGTLVQELGPKITAALPELLTTVLPGMVSAGISMLGAVGEGIVAAVPELVSIAGEALANAAPAILETAETALAQIIDFVLEKLFGIETDFDTTLGNIQNFFQAVFESIQNTVETAFQVITDVWNTIGQPIFDSISGAVEVAAGVFSNKMPEIQTFVSDCFNDISNYWENSLKPCLDAIGSFIENVLAPAFNAVFEEYITKIVDEAFHTIKTLWDDVLKPVFTGITDFITGVFSGDWRKALEGLADIGNGVFNAIADTINSVMEGAFSTIKDTIERIKSVFNFKWSLPELKLPHITVKGSFSLSPPSVPTFGISWYAKAMDNPMLLNGATIFGAMGGNLLGGGEAGAEVVSGADTLMNMIRNAVTDTLYEGNTSGLEERIDRVLALLERYFPEFASADVVLSTGQLVGAIVTEIDRQLGIINKRRNRE